MKIEIGKGLEIEVNTEELREKQDSWNHVVYIGLRNILMDAHAGVKKEDFTGDDAAQKYRDESLAMSMKKLDALMRNEVRANRGATRLVAADPVEAEALREARVFILGRARGWEKGKVEALHYIEALRVALGELATATPKEILASAVKRRASKPESIAAAQAIVEARKSIQVDVADLGL